MLLQVATNEPEIEKKFNRIDDPTRAALAFRSLCDQTSALNLLHRSDSRLRREIDRGIATIQRLRAHPLLPHKTLRNEPDFTPRTGTEPRVFTEPRP